MADNAQISGSHMTGQSSDLCIGGKFSSESFSTSTSSSSEPSGSLEALGSGKVDGAARREGRIGVNHPSGVTHTHTLYTQGVQTVHKNKFSHKSVSADNQLYRQYNISGFSAANCPQNL